MSRSQILIKLFIPASFSSSIGSRYVAKENMNLTTNEASSKDFFFVDKNLVTKAGDYLSCSFIDWSVSIGCNRRHLLAISPDTCQQDSLLSVDDRPPVWVSFDREVRRFASSLHPASSWTPPVSLISAALGRVPISVRPIVGCRPSSDP